MKFTNEEIKLCKEIAKYYVKEFQYGIPVAKDRRKTIEISMWNLPIGLTEKQRRDGKWTPLWIWQDAREWLIKRKYWFQLDYHPDCKPQYKLKLFKNTFNPLSEQKGKTDLEAILKVILNILETSK